MSEPTGGVPGTAPRATSNQQPATTGAARKLAARTLLLAVILVLAPLVSACPVCWGAPDDPMVKGVNSGVWVLLGLVGVVQIGFVALFWSFWKRAREQRQFRESLRVIEGGPHA